MYITWKKRNRNPEKKQKTKQILTFTVILQTIVFTFLLRIEPVVIAPTAAVPEHVARAGLWVKVPLQRVIPTRASRLLQTTPIWKFRFLLFFIKLNFFLDRVTSLHTLAHRLEPVVIAFAASVPEPPTCAESLVVEPLDAERVAGTGLGRETTHR